MIIAEIPSIELRKVLKKGDFEAFTALVNLHNISADACLYGKRESSCWSLIQFCLDNAFTNSNVRGRLEIANYLVKNGAKLNDIRPYGASVLYSFLYQNFYLKDTRAKYEVYLLTLIFALELLRQPSIDVRASKMVDSFEVLEAAARVYDLHKGNNNDELAKIAAQIVLELIEKGAKISRTKTWIIDMLEALTKENDFKIQKDAFLR